MELSHPDRQISSHQSARYHSNRQGSEISTDGTDDRNTKWHYHQEEIIWEVRESRKEELEKCEK